MVCHHCILIYKHNKSGLRPAEVAVAKAMATEGGGGGIRTHVSLLQLRNLANSRNGPSYATPPASQLYMSTTVHTNPDFAPSKADHHGLSP